MAITTQQLTSMLVATILGALIGLERQVSRKPVGLRTNILICLGACIFTIISLQLGVSLGASPERMAANVVQGSRLPRRGRDHARPRDHPGSDDRGNDLARGQPWRRLRRRLLPRGRRGHGTGPVRPLRPASTGEETGPAPPEAITARPSKNEISEGCVPGGDGRCRSKPEQRKGCTHGTTQRESSVARRPEGRRRHRGTGQRRLPRHVHRRIALRIRDRHQSRGTDRSRTRRVLLDGPGARPRAGGLLAREHRDLRQGLHREGHRTVSRSPGFTSTRREPSRISRRASSSGRRKSPRIPARFPRPWRARRST